MRLCGFRLAAWFLLAGTAWAGTAESDSHLYAYVDPGGEANFTSDGQDSSVEAADSDSVAGEANDADEDAGAISVSLGQYLERYASPGLRALGLRLTLDVSMPSLVLPSRNHDAWRRVARRAELLATVDGTSGAAASPAIRDELARLLFPPLRSIYPNAYLTLVIHDGVRTVCRADWDPAQPEPATLVR